MQTNLSRVVAVLADHKTRSFTVKEMAEAVGIDYQKNWNKRAPRIARKLIARGYVVRTVTGRTVRLSLDPRWADTPAADICLAFTEGREHAAPVADAPAEQAATT